MASIVEIISSDSEDADALSEYEGIKAAIRCFDREHSSRLVFPIKSEQDKMKRYPSASVVQRFLATKWNNRLWLL